MTQKSKPVVTVKNSHGFSLALALTTVLVVAVLSGAGWYVWNKNSGTKKSNDSASHTKKNDPIKNDEVKPSDLYEGWHSFNNATYGISFKYPVDWKLTEGAITSPSSSTSQEYSIVLRLQKEFKYNETLSIEILNQGLEKTVSWYDKYYTQSSLNEVTKTNNMLKGRQSTQYSVVNSGESSKLYLFSVGSKTYLFSSVGNSELDPDFWVKFDKVFESLQISEGRD